MIDKEQELKDYTNYKIYIQNTKKNIFRFGEHLIIKDMLQKEMSYLDGEIKLNDFSVIYNYDTSRFEVFFSTNNVEDITLENVINDYILQVNKYMYADLVVVNIEKDIEKPDDNDNKNNDLIPEVSAINSTITLIIILVFGFYGLRFINEIFFE